MARIPLSEALVIQGPAGGLEALLETPREGLPRGIAVVCHPHPLHQGTMHNKVVHTLGRAFTACGMSALRFNFRGVGASEGSFDDGPGEIEDALAVARAGRGRVPEGPLWLAGFSFGAAIAIGAAAELAADGLVTVAPAVTRVAGMDRVAPRCPWLVIQGDRDELVNVDDTIEWVNSLEPGPELQVFSETSHFFHGKLVELRKAVEAFVREAGPGG